MRCAESARVYAVRGHRVRGVSGPKCDVCRSPLALGEGAIERGVDRDDDIEAGDLKYPKHAR